MNNDAVTNEVQRVVAALGDTIQWAETPGDPTSILVVWPDESAARITVTPIPDA